MYVSLLFSIELCFDCQLTAQRLLNLFHSSFVLSVLFVDQCYFPTLTKPFPQSSAWAVPPLGEAAIVPTEMHMNKHDAVSLDFGIMITTAVPVVQIFRRIHVYLSFQIYLSDILHFSFLMHVTSKRGPYSFM